MKKAISILVLVFAGLGVISPLGYKVAESVVLRDTVSSIEFDKESIDVYPGQSFYLNPISKNPFGELCKEPTYQFSTPHDSILTVNNSGKVVVSKTAKDSDEASVYVESGMAKSEMKINVVSGVYRIIDVATDQDDFENLNLGKTYSISFESLSSSIGPNDLSVEVLDENHQPLDQVMEVSFDGALNIRPVGIFSGYLRFTAKKGFNGVFADKTVHFNTHFVSDCLSNLFQGSSLKKSEIDSFEELTITSGNTIDLGEVKNFRSLKTLIVQQAKTVDFIGNDEPTFDIMVQPSLFDNYELHEKRAIANKIFPVSDKNILVVYSDNAESPFYPYKVIYKEGNEPTLIDDGEADIVGYELQGLYKDSQYTDIATGFDSLPKRTRLYALYDANSYKVYLHSNYGGDQVISTIEIDYNSKITELPVLEHRPDYAFKGWQTPEGDTMANGDVYRVPGNLHLYANWQDTFNIFFDEAGGNPVSPMEVHFNKTFSLPSTTKMKSVLNCWLYEDAEFVNDLYSFDHDITLVADWIGDYSSFSDFLTNADQNQYSRSVIDLSALANGSTVGTLTIPSYCKELTIIGSHSSSDVSDYYQYKLGRIVAEQSTNPLKLKLVNLNIKSDYTGLPTLDLRNRNADVEVDISGNVTISGSDHWFGETVVFGSDHLTFTGEGLLTCNGLKRATVESNDDEFLYDLLDDNRSSERIFNGTGTLSFMCETIVNGGQGFNTFNGRTGSNAYSDGGSGMAGESGYNGLDAPVVIKARELVIDTDKNVSIVGGAALNGGRGGNGGNGKDGSRGKDGSLFGGWNGGNGGNGGQGGSGGKGGSGGNASPVLNIERITVTEKSSNFYITESAPGCGGYGGNGGNGGNGGSGGSGYMSGSNGNQGSGGLGGIGGYSGSFGNNAYIISGLQSFDIQNTIHLITPVLDRNESMQGTHGSNGSGGDVDAITGADYSRKITRAKEQITYSDYGYEAYVVRV